MINYHEKLLKDSIEANTRYLLHAGMNESEIRECNEKIRQYTDALDNLTSSSRITQQRELLDAFAEYMHKYHSHFESKEPKDYVTDYLSSNGA